MGRGGDLCHSHGGPLRGAFKAILFSILLLNSAIIKRFTLLRSETKTIVLHNCSSIRMTADGSLETGVQSMLKRHTERQRQRQRSSP